VRSVTSFALCSCLVGCGAFSHVGECRRVSESVNGATADVQTELAKYPDAQAPVYFAIATRYKTLRQDLTRLKMRDNQLDKAVRRLARDVNTLATTTEQYADVLQRVQGAEPLPERSELDGIRQRFAREQETYLASLDKVRSQCEPAK
jgi:septal ring factor EnvC (AmiA/AmiB activator)